MTQGIAGVYAYVKFGWESTYGTGVTADKLFGHDVKVSNFSMTNNTENIYNLGNAEGQAFAVKKFSGSISLEFKLGSTWWLRGVTGNTPVKSGSGPYTYKWIDSSATPTAIAKVLESMTLDFCHDLSTDVRLRLLGCVIANVEFSTAIDEAVMVKVDLLFGNASMDTTTSFSSLADTATDPMTFAYGTFQVPASSTIADVQDVSVAINRNSELTYGLGSRFAQNQLAKRAEYAIKASVLFSSNTMLQKLFGGSSGPVANPADAATLDLTFDNGKSTTSQRSLQLQFSNVQVANYDLPAATDEKLVEGVEFVARTWNKAIGINNTSAEP